MAFWEFKVYLIFKTIFACVSFPIIYCFVALSNVSWHADYFLFLQLLSHITSRSGTLSPINSHLKNTSIGEDGFNTEHFYCKPSFSQKINIHSLHLVSLCWDLTLQILVVLHNTSNLFHKVSHIQLLEYMHTCMLQVGSCLLLGSYIIIDNWLLW